MTHPEYEYLKLMVDIIKNGKTKPTRGIHPIKSVFGRQVHFDMRAGFPLLTTKKMPFNILLHELFWFISGSSDVTYLHEHGIKYWDGFLHEGSNDLGRVYGVQWRHWKRPDGQPEFDQLAWAIEQLKTNPDSKGIIVTAWNAGELGDKRWNPNDYGDMRLPPCHSFFQFDLTKGKLRMNMYQRSWDVFLGAPFNIAQYALLLHMVAYLIGAEPRELIISVGNAHLYTNHIEDAKEQLKRKPYLRSVDFVTILPEPSCVPTLGLLKPDVFITVKEDWAAAYKDSKEYKIVTKYGGEVKVVDRQSTALSTTKIVQRAIGGQLGDIFKDFMELRKDPLKEK